MRIKLLKFFIHKYVAFQRIKSYSDLYNLGVEVFLYRGFVSNFQKKRNSVEHFQPIVYSEISEIDFFLLPLLLKSSKIHLYFFILQISLKSLHLFVLQILLNNLKFMYIPSFLYTSNLPKISPFTLTC